MAHECLLIARSGHSSPMRGECPDWTVGHTHRAFLDCHQRRIRVRGRGRYGLVGLGFSEQQELEADVAGMILAAEAGYDPRAAIALHERFAKLGLDWTEQGEEPTLMVREVGVALGKALQQYFATHPPAKLRIRQLEQATKRNARAWQGQRFYVGKSNYRDRIPRGSVEREDEWLTYGQL